MATLADRIYWKSPIWLQQAAVSVWGMAWYYRRFGRKFRQFVGEFHARDGWTLEQFQQYQRQKLAALLEAA